MPFNQPFANFLPFNPVRKPAKQQLFGAGLNPNDFTQQNLTQQSQQEEQQRQAAQGPPSLADAYAKMSGNRPQRLAYQNAVEAGPEQIQRGKWAKLGAMLAAGGSALGGTRAPDATALGLSSYYEPQRRSDEDYKRRTGGLGNLANMEESDMQEKLKVLELQNKDFYANQENIRQNKQENRADTLSKAQIANIYSEMDKRDTDEWDEKGTGIHWTRKPNGQLTGEKRGYTTAEEVAAEKAATVAKEEALEPGRIAASNRAGANDAASDARTAASSLININAANAGKENVANIKAGQQAAALRQKALTSTGRAKQQELDMADAIDKEPALKGFNLGDIVEKVGGIYKVKDIGEGTIWDDKAVIAARDKVREALERSGQAPATNTSGATGAAGPSGPKGVTSAPIDNRRFIPDPTDPTNTISNPGYGKPRVN